MAILPLVAFRPKMIPSALTGYVLGEVLEAYRSRTVPRGGWFLDGVEGNPSSHFSLPNAFLLGKSKMGMSSGRLARKS